MEKSELLHIFLAWLVISIAFSWKGFSNIKDSIYLFPALLLATGTGFIFHELAHKFVAIHYRAKARFFMWPFGLLFALLMSFITAGSFVFAAPGAVYIWGRYLTRKQNGIISLAGPASNFLIAFVFFIISLFISQLFILKIVLLVVYVNLFLGAFNLLPIPPLDGYKVFLWNKGIWIMSMLVFAISFFLIF